MYGGGKYSSMNKILPGFYYKFDSAKNDAIAQSDRGKAAVGLELDWGADGEIIRLDAWQFRQNAAKYFGYDSTSEKLTPIREVFKNATELICYRLNSGGEKATCKYATAKCSGTRGNDITIVISKAVDETDKFDVYTFLKDEKGNNIRKDKQRVSAMTELVDNDFVTFITTATLAEDAGTALTGGTNGTATGESHSAFLAKLERVHYHCLGCNSSDETTIALYSEYQKRMSHDCGKVAQLVVYGYTAENKEIRPDSYDVIVLENKVVSSGVPAHYGIFWVIGAQAGCAVNKTVQNAIYNGEYKLDVDYTQAELALKMEHGKFMFHETINTADVSEIRVLADINSFETVTESESKDYKQNQVIRVLYQIITDVGSNFNANWMGVVNNDADGRDAFKGECVKYMRGLQRIRAISNFDPEKAIVALGDDVESVVIALPFDKVLAMFACYSNITVG